MTAMKAILLTFVSADARERFIDSIRETRDSFDGVSAAQWNAWDMLLTDANTCQAELADED